MSEDDASSPDSRTSQDLSSVLAEDAATRSTLIGHFYRAEVNRATVWRSRLDQTTRWAVVVVAAILTWTFSSPDNPHYVLLIGMLAVIAFLLIEAHRYREYDIWRRRVRLLQEHVFVGVLSPGTSRDTSWQAELSESLLSPAFTMPFRTAVGHRLRRMYISLLLILLAAWVARITVFHPDETWQQSATIPGVSGVVVVTVVGLFYVVVIGVALWSIRRGEVREFQE